jgi:hypothetical protein
MTRDESRERERETISGACYMTISKLSEVIPFEITDYRIPIKKAAIERRYADTTCTGGMAPPSMI